MFAQISHFTARPSLTPLSFLSSNGNQFANVAEIRDDPRRQREYAKQLELLNPENYRQPFLAFLQGSVLFPLAVKEPDKH